jgi:hypothetical protein
MRVRVAAMLALSLCGGLLLSAGCLRIDANGSDAPTFTPSRAAPSPMATPARDGLLAALQRTQAAPFRYTVQSNLPDNTKVSATGAFDLTGRLYEATTTITGGTLPGSYQRIVVGTNSYLRQAGDKKWVHLDLSRVKKDSLVYFDMTDPTGLAEFITMVGSVQRTGPHAYSGSFNPYAGPERFLPIGAPSLEGIGGGTAPFTMTTDAQDRVSAIHIELSRPDGPTLAMTTTLSEQGKALRTRAPAKASVAEADDMYYK